MWHSIIKKCQSPKAQSQAECSRVAAEQKREEHVKYVLSGMEAQRDLLKTLEEQFEIMQFERDAARFVSISLANAAVEVKRENHEEMLDHQAAAIAWKSIANAALDI